ncbi:hypothetical protein IT575_01440 [bacterium]|nr:hypothetical protein [bacterium]
MRESRALRISLLCLGLLTLLAYSYDFARCSQLAPTGDALFDKYARTVRDRGAWKLFHGLAPAVLPDNLLASWEGEFGADPRYWELRYWCAVNDPRATRQWNSNEAARGVMVEARHRNAVDSDLQWFWWQAEFVRMQREQNDARYAREKDNFELAAMLEQYDQAELKLLDQVVAGGTERAWPYYFRARKHMELGDDSAALADLKSGNAAPDVGSLRCFPASKVYELAWQGGPAGSAALSGAVIELEQRRALPNYIKIKECAKESLLFAGLGGDSELATQWFRAACRMGTDPQSDDISALVGRSIAGLINDYYLNELSEGLSHDQVMGLLAVDELLDRARGSLGSFSGSQEYRYPGLRLSDFLTSRKYDGVSSNDSKSWTSLFETPGQRLGAWLDWKQGHLIPARHFEQAFARFSAEAVYRRENLAALQLQLLDFDYATMQRPPDWLPRGPGLNEPGY